MSSGIYQIRNKVNGKIYVGSGIILERREKEHLRRLRKNKHYNPHLQRAWNEYGEQNFVFEVLEKIQEKSSLIEREQYYLDLLKSYEKEKGYNVCRVAGNTLGFKMPREIVERLRLIQKQYRPTKETREKMSLAHAGEKHPMFGKHHTDEIKEKISQTLMGKYPNDKNPNSKLTNEQVITIRKERKINKRPHYQIAKDYNVSVSTIQKILQNRTWKAV